MENWLLTAVLSLDTLFACMAYGIQKIKIPFRSALVMAAVGTCFLQISILARNFIGYLFPEEVIRYLGFAVLIIMGMLNIFQSLLKNIFRRDKTFRLHISDFNFVLNICIDETKADLDRSKKLSVKEAFLLALTLSADSLLTGFSITADAVTFGLLSLFSFCLGVLAVLAGTKIGVRLCRGKERNLSWLSGMILIGIAFFKIL